MAIKEEFIHAALSRVTLNPSLATRPQMLSTSLKSQQFGSHIWV